MKTMKQRVIAILCCVALLVTSLYIVEPQKADAATATSTISITTKEYGYNQSTGYMNLSYTGVAGDYANTGSNFLDESFAEENITFGGGMTYANLIDGMVTFYIASNSVLQFNWGNRTTPFTYGWSFTIAQGALLPYRTSTGTSYMALDKEYTFTFVESNNGYECEVKITSCNSGTFSMASTNPSSVLGNGTSGSRNYSISVTNYSNPDAYTQCIMTDDSAYDGYVDFNGTDTMSELSATGLEVRWILANDGSTCVLQVTDWGTWREKLTANTYWAFKKGMPIQWTSGGETYKAVLDATYVYYVTGSNTDNTQVYYSFKYDESLNNYGLSTFTSKTTATQSNGYYINIAFDATSQGTITAPGGSSAPNYITSAWSCDYFDFAGWTDTELSNYGVKIDFIPGANVIQVVLNGAGVNALEVGDVITLKDGLPIIYYDYTQKTMQSAVLKGNYEITVNAKTNTTDTSATTGGDGSVTFSMIETGTYGLTGSTSSCVSESNAKYQNIYLDTADFDDITVKLEGNFNTQTMIDNYFYANRGGKTVDLSAEGWYFRYYYFMDSSGNQMFRYYCPDTYATFTEGDYIIWRKGLPITYTTARGTKTVTLDKDYGYVWNGSKFVYDASLVYVEPETSYEFTMTMGSYNSFTEDDKYVKIGIPTTNTSGIAKEQYPILADTIDETTWNTYIDFCGMDYAAVKAANIEMRYLIFANQFRIHWLQSDTSWLSNLTSNTITFKKGLPVPVTADDGSTVNVVLTDDITFYVYQNDDGTVTVGKESIEYKTTITSKSATGFFEGEQYKMNIGMSDEPDLSGVSSEYVALLTNAETAEYIDICGIEAATLSEAGVKVTYIPAANVFQIVFGTDHTWLSVGDEITFMEGMPIPVTVDGETVTVTLQNTMTYRVDSITNAAPYVTMAAYTETEEFYINGSQHDGIRGETAINYTVYDADGNTGVLSDCASGAGYANTALSYTTMANYMDFCGLTAAELEAYGVKVQLAAGDGNEIMQIYTGTMAANMIAGETITFKKGLPFTYKTTEGYKKIITLAKDYTFVVGEGITADGVTYACRWHYTEIEPSEWRLKSGVVNNVNGSETETEGYFNNLPFGSSPLLEENTSLNYHFTTTQMEKYIDFAGLDAEDYGIKAIAIITENDQVVQLRWGTAATLEDLEGKTVTFKAGLPIIVSETKVYKLLADVVYTIEKSANGNNGYCLSNMVEVTKTQPGDADGDYILNVNDVNLIREALADIVIADVNTQDVNEDGVLSSADLVRAKANFDIPENEDNGTETYTLLADREVGLRTMGASSDDMKTAATSITYDLNVDLGTNNYLRLTYKTDTDLRGEFIYTVDGGSAVTEEFFLEADDVQFEQFLDVYRKNSINGGVKNGSKIVLKQIILYNLSTSQATNVRLYEVETAARTLVTNDMLWAENGDVKIGVDLNMGGSLAWMECLKYNICEYISDNDSIIGTAAQCEAVGGDKQITSGVNLINIHDLGRQIQQSYYSVPTGQKDWDGVEFELGTCGESDGEKNWPYNPVQAGDGVDNQGQIVDYRVIDQDGVNVIYVKARAMDWSYAETHTDVEGGKTTDSYMEAWYSIEGALVYVDNRFIDWSGYDYSVEDRTQELPAFYVGQGLNTLVSDKAGVQQKDTNLGKWTGTDAYRNNTTTTDWYAFVNSEEADAFGVGIYIPNVEQTAAGRVADHRSVAWWKFTSINKNAAESPLLDFGYTYWNNLYKGDYQNCFVSNTSYIAPVCSGYMKGYEDYSYTYVLTADMLNNIGNSFAELKENGVVDNSSLAKWEIKYE